MLNVKHLVLNNGQDAAIGSEQHPAAAADLLLRTVEALLGQGALLVSEIVVDAVLVEAFVSCQSHCTLALRAVHR